MGSAIAATFSDAAERDPSAPPGRKGRAGGGAARHGARGRRAEAVTRPATGQAGGPRLEGYAVAGADLVDRQGRHREVVGGGEVAGAAALHATSPVRRAGGWAPGRVSVACLGVECRRCSKYPASWIARLPRKLHPVRGRSR